MGTLLNSIPESLLKSSNQLGERYKFVNVEEFVNQFKEFVNLS